MALDTNLLNKFKKAPINYTMNLNNFTIKAAEAIQQAQQLAFNAQNPSIETEHILKALLDMEESPIEYLLKKNNVTVNLLENKLDELLLKLPKIAGEPAQQIGREANTAMMRATAVLSIFYLPWFKETMQ